MGKIKQVFDDAIPTMPFWVSELILIAWILVILLS